MLRVYLFGAFGVEREGHIVTGLETRRIQEVFSYLLLNRDHRCSRELLASQFWAESSTAQSKKNLRQILWQLQTALDRASEPGAQRILRVTTDWLQINPQADLWLDVDYFEQAWNKVKQRPAKSLEAPQAQLLRNAVALHQGELLRGNYEDWCLRERERLLSACIAMLEALMEYSEAHHDYESALGYGARILGYDRAREATHWRLMHLYSLLGRRIEALKQYQRCEAALQEELGAAPSKSTRILYQRILLDQPASGPLAETTAVDASTDTLLLTSVLAELRQIQRIQADLQSQIQYHIQRMEKTLQGLPDAFEEKSQRADLFKENIRAIRH
jgi:DNA-binding SARP family transcriptional activator